MDNYRIEKIAPLETVGYKEDYSKKLVHELKAASQQILESNRRLESKIESVVSLWGDFIKSLKDIDVPEDNSSEELAEQNRQIIKQNNRILDSMQDIIDSVERAGRSRPAGRSMPSHSLSPRKYPKIRIVK